MRYEDQARLQARGLAFRGAASRPTNDGSDISKEVSRLHAGILCLHSGFNLFAFSVTSINTDPLMLTARAEDAKDATPTGKQLAVLLPAWP